MEKPSKPDDLTGEEDPSRDRSDWLLGLMLLLLAGWLDAVGLVFWNELYVSFMSGNTVQLAGSPVVADWDGMSRSARALTMFVLGVVAGELVDANASPGRRSVVVSIEAMLIWLATGAELVQLGEGVVASFAGLAMGLQTSVVRKAGGVSIALTYVTGTTVHVGRSIASALKKEKPWRNTLPYVTFWLSLFVGAIAGASASRIGIDFALVGAALLGTAVMLYSVVLAVLVDRR